MFNPENYGYEYYGLIGCLDDEDFTIISKVNSLSYDWYFLSCVGEPVLMITNQHRVWIKDISDIASVMDEVKTLKKLLVSQTLAPIQLSLFSL